MSSASGQERPIGERLLSPIADVHLWLGIFNLMVIAQYWAFAADLYTEDQGKRIFPLIGVGSSLGAWVGSLRAGQIVERIGTARLLVAGAVLLVVCAGLARVANAKRPRDGDATTAAAHEKPLGGAGGFSLIFSDRQLRDNSASA